MASAGEKRTQDRGRGESSAATSALHLKGDLTQVIFSTSPPHTATLWVRGLLAILTLFTLTRDIEQPRETKKNTSAPYITRTSHAHRESTHCNITPTQWTHMKCSGINIRQYTNTWKSNINKAPSNSTHAKNQTAQNMNQSSNPLQNQIPLTSTLDNTTTNNNPQTTQDCKSTNKTKCLNFLQFNINRIHKQKQYLNMSLDQHKIDITTIIETKWEKPHKTSQFNNYTTPRQDRSHKAGRDLTTLVRHDIHTQTYTSQH